MTAGIKKKRRFLERRRTGLPSHNQCMGGNAEGNLGKKKKKSSDHDRASSWSRSTCIAEPLQPLLLVDIPRRLQHHKTMRKIQCEETAEAKNLHREMMVKEMCKECPLSLRSYKGNKIRKPPPPPRFL